MTPPPPRKPGSNGATNLAYAGDRGEVELEAVGVGLTPPPPPPSVHPENVRTALFLLLLSKGSFDFRPRLDGF